jgi:hypothetical protein
MEGAQALHPDRAAARLRLRSRDVALDERVVRRTRNQASAFHSWRGRSLTSVTARSGVHPMTRALAIDQLASPEVTSNRPQLLTVPLDDDVAVGVRR